MKVWFLGPLQAEAKASIQIPELLLGSRKVPGKGLQVASDVGVLSWGKHPGKSVRWTHKESDTPPPPP